MQRAISNCPTWPGTRLHGSFGFDKAPGLDIVPSRSTRFTLGTPVTVSGPQWVNAGVPTGFGASSVAPEA